MNKIRDGRGFSLVHLTWNDPNGRANDALVCSKCTFDEALRKNVLNMHVERVLKLCCYSLKRSLTKRKKKKKK